MIKAGGGSIVNIASVYGLIGNGDFPPYHASKGAVIAITRNDATIYAKYNIRVNAVCPGATWTKMVEEAILKSGLSIEEGKKSLCIIPPIPTPNRPRGSSIRSSIPNIG